MLPALVLLCSILPADGPQTYAALKAEMPLSDAARRQALRDFADEDRASITDRIKAAKALTKQSTAPEDKLAAWLQVAALYGTAGRAGPRSKALKQADKQAKKLRDKKAQKRTRGLLKAARAADKAAKSLTKSLKKKRKRPPAKLSDKDRKLLETLAAGRKAYAGLGDDAAARRAALLVAELYAVSTGGAKKSRAGFKKLIDADGRRDHERVAQRAHLGLSRLEEDKKRLEQAALASLAADRAVTVPVSRPAFDAAPALYRRSPRSSRLCAALWDEKNVSCARLEQDKWGAPSFQDFSQGRRQRRFSDRDAKIVLSDYRVLLEDCVKQSDDLTEFDTEVALSWEVSPDGRVSEYDTRPRHLKMGKTSSCLDEAFATIRYPRFKGPPAQVELTWDVDTKRAGSR